MQSGDSVHEKLCCYDENIAFGKQTGTLWFHMTTLSPKSYIYILLICKCKYCTFRKKQKAYQGLIRTHFMYVTKTVIIPPT